MYINVPNCKPEHVSFSFDSNIMETTIDRDGKVWDWTYALFDRISKHKKKRVPQLNDAGDPMQELAQNDHGEYRWTEVYDEVEIKPEVTTTETQVKIWLPKEKTGVWPYVVNEPKSNRTSSYSTGTDFTSFEHQMKVAEEVDRRTLRGVQDLGRHYGDHQYAFTRSTKETHGRVVTHDVDEIGRGVHYIKAGMPVPKDLEQVPEDRYDQVEIVAHPKRSETFETFPYYCFPSNEHGSIEKYSVDRRRSGLQSAVETGWKVAIFSVDAVKRGIHLKRAKLAEPVAKLGYFNDGVYAIEQTVSTRYAEDLSSRESDGTCVMSDIIRVALGHHLDGKIPEDRKPIPGHIYPRVEMIHEPIEDDGLTEFPAYCFSESVQEAVRHYPDHVLKNALAVFKRELAECKKVKAEKPGKPYQVHTIFVV